MTATPEMLVDSERAVRRALVTLEHMNSENTQEWDRTIKTFSRPRYELPDGRVVMPRVKLMQRHPVRIPRRVHSLGMHEHPGVLKIRAAVSPTSAMHNQPITGGVVHRGK